MNALSLSPLSDAEVLEVRTRMQMATVLKLVEVRKRAPSLACFEAILRGMVPDDLPRANSVAIRIDRVVRLMAEQEAADARMEAYNAMGHQIRAFAESLEGQGA